MKIKTPVITGVFSCLDYIKIIDYYCKMNKILYKITRYLLGILIKRNVDVSKLVPETDLNKLRRSLEQRVYYNHANMSLLRMDIMRMQNDFIKSLKEPVMMQLSSMSNIEDRNLMAKDYEEQLLIINEKYDEHKIAVEMFDLSSEKLIEFKNANKLI